jgi:hypothetical protein
LPFTWSAISAPTWDLPDNNGPEYTVQGTITDAEGVDLYTKLTVRVAGNPEQQPQATDDDYDAAISTLFDALASAGWTGLRVSQSAIVVRQSV